jgi:hypothetical protein
LSFFAQLLAACELRWCSVLCRMLCCHGWWMVACFQRLLLLLLWLLLLLLHLLCGS